MAIRLPTNKLLKARTIVQAVLQQHSLSLLELQQITGYLNFVSTCNMYTCSGNCIQERSAGFPMFSLITLLTLIILIVLQPRSYIKAR